VVLPLFNTVLLDVTVLLCCVACLMTFTKMSVTHPATIYLLFHGLFFTARAIAILNGATTLFSWKGAIPVSESEIARSLMLADLALIAMTSAWILAAHLTARPSAMKRDAKPRRLRPELLKPVAIVCILVGCAAMLLWSKLPGISTPLISAGQNSNWIVIPQTWVGLSLLALIYWYGFRPGLLIGLAGYFAWVIYQANFRFRLLITLILLMQIYLDRRGRSWPGMSGISVFVISALLFFPLKGIGQQLQAGQGAGEVLENARTEIASVFTGDHPDQTILDQFASALTLADARGQLYWGLTYAGLLTVAIPRQWWPEKPGLTEYEHQISTSDRPMADTGMVVTMLGEFYLNFAYPGVVIMSFAVAYFTGVWFDAAYRAGYLSLMHFTYLLVACNLIQVYRDGLISLFVFTVINMFPLVLLVALHVCMRRKRTLYTQAIIETPRVRQPMT